MVLSLGLRSRKWPEEPARHARYTTPSRETGLLSPPSARGLIEKQTVNMGRNREAFRDVDLGSTGYQYLENMATGYWYSQALFAALELEVFTLIEAGATTTSELAQKAQCRENELLRLLQALEGLRLLIGADGIWMNGPAARRHLVIGSPGYLGEFFLYRQYMQQRWLSLTERVRGTKKATENLDYKERNLRYVRAMDHLARQKACEITGIIGRLEPPGPILDVGGGAGAFVRSLLAKENEGRTAVRGVLFDIPEVIAAAQTLYPDADSWRGITRISGDFRSHSFTHRYGAVILSNFLHAYAPAEANELLHKALGLVEDDGIVLIQDYFPDRRGAVAEKGALYDLCMMVNTFNGVCHTAKTICGWLQESGIERMTVLDLETDSSLILAGGPARHHSRTARWPDLAYTLGFDQAMLIGPDDVVTAPWVEMKCRFGCKNFDRNLQCPPYAGDYTTTRTLLNSYTSILLVQGQPPGTKFHDMLLELERQAFLSGAHKALAFGAGPCTLCEQCPGKGACRHPERARPAMEAAGIDVYATVHKQGWHLEPVREKDGFVKYFGLLLIQ